MFWRRIGIALVLFVLFATQISRGTIVDTPHNLSFNSGQQIRAESPSDTQVCKFCHIPHRATNPTSTTIYGWYMNIYPTVIAGEPATSWKLPLIGHTLTGTSNYVYGVQVSSWSFAPIYPTDYSDGGQEWKGGVIERWMPSGTSRVCLSCHDGTLVIGSLITGVTMYVQDYLGAGKISAGKLTSVSTCYYNTTGPAGSFGDTHTSGHNFYSNYVTEEVKQDYLGNPYDTYGSLKSLSYMRSGQEGVKLDENDFVQCSTCHDPHKNQTVSGGVYKFWRRAGISDNTCTVCHTY